MPSKWRFCNNKDTKPLVCGFTYGALQHTCNNCNYIFYTVESKLYKEIIYFNEMFNGKFIDINYHDNKVYLYNKDNVYFPLTKQLKKDLGTKESMLALLETGSPRL